MTREIRLFAAVAVRPAVLALIPRFEAQSGFAVEARWALNPAVRAEIEAGAPFDLTVTNPHLIEDLIVAGKVDAASHVPFGSIAMGVAAKAGSRPIDIGSVADFTQALKRASSIAYASEGSSGGYFVGLLERLGIADAVRPRLVPISGGQTAAAVGRGEAELAVVPVTSILAAAPEVMLIGRFPEEFQSYIEFAIGISAQARDAAAARHLSDFLRSPACDGILAEKGVERAPPYGN